MNQVDPAFEAVHVRLHPQTWHRWISMRVELFGCSGKPYHNFNVKYMSSMESMTALMLDECFQTH